MLSNWKLSYFASSNDKFPKGSFNLRKVKASVEINNNPLKFSIFIEGVKREFKFKTKTAENRNYWWNEISKHIREGEKTSSYDSDLVKVKNFWRKQEQITSEYFLANANSGDILLFKGKRLASKLTRGVTNSNYDHVAMVLKFDKGIAYAKYKHVITLLIVCI